MHNIQIFKMEEPKLEIKPIAALRFVEWAIVVWEAMAIYVIDLTLWVASKQLGPWPQPDITLFSRMYE